ncbi:MAG: hypothetical protein MJD61_01545 [Proteobacteria bacterium]|nr:hypothetical protein [Pseudomonadota bacterium]
MTRVPAAGGGGGTAGRGAPIDASDLRIAPSRVGPRVAVRDFATARDFVAARDLNDTAGSFKSEQTTPVWRWFFADVHIHAVGCQRAAGPWAPEWLAPNTIFAAMDKRGLDVGSALIWGQSGWMPDRSNATDYEWPWIIGTDNTDPGYPGKILRYDLEASGYPASDMGHITVLGLKNVAALGPCGCENDSCRNRNTGCNVPSLHELYTSTMPKLGSGLPFVAWAMNQSVTGGQADVYGVNHTQAWRLDYTNSVDFLAPRELPVHVAKTGPPWPKFMAVEIPEPDPGGQAATGPMPRGAFQLWSDILDSGYYIALAGGSDNRCMQKQIGMMRTALFFDDAAGGGLTFNQYTNALNGGRTVLVAGAREDPNCDDMTCDDWASLAIQWHSGSNPVGGTAHIGNSYHVINHHDVFNFSVTGNLLVDGAVQVLWNGHVFLEWQVDAGPIDLSSNVPLTNVPSGWVTVRTPRAQTSPIYVVTSGRPIHHPLPTANPQLVPDPQAPCRMAQHVQNLINHTPGSSQHSVYEQALGAYLGRASDHGTTCNLGAAPDPPPPSCPSTPEEDMEPLDDYPDYFPGKQLTVDPVNVSTQRITGRLTRQNTAVLWSQPFGGAPQLCPRPGIDPIPTWCPDHDHFVIPVTCVDGKSYLRGRIVLRTEASLNLEPYRVEYCWSDSSQRCGIDHDNDPNTPRLVTSRLEGTSLGGGTNLNAPIDVACNPNQELYLNIWVAPGGPAGWIPAHSTQCDTNPEPANCCDVYSLYYSVEGVDDGFIYSNGSGATEYSTPTANPSNP